MASGYSLLAAVGNTLAADRSGPNSLAALLPAPSPPAAANTVNIYTNEMPERYALPFLVIEGDDEQCSIREYPLWELNLTQIVIVAPGITNLRTIGLRVCYVLDEDPVTGAKIAIAGRTVAYFTRSKFVVEKSLQRQQTNFPTNRIRIVYEAQVAGSQPSGQGEITIPR